MFRKTLILSLCLMASVVSAQVENDNGQNAPQSLLESMKSRFPTIMKCETMQGLADICTFSSVTSATPAFRYTQPVAFVIPRLEEGAIVNPSRIMIHIQGHRGVCRRASDGRVDTNFTALETLNNFGMVSQFVEAIREAKATNSILVFPASTGKNTDYFNQLVGQFGSFVKWIDKVAQPEENAGLYISGHSGAGSVIPASLANATQSAVPRLKAVLLQDATYGSGRTTQWQAFSRLNRSFLIESIYIAGSATQAGSLDLKARVTLGRPVSLVKSTVGHCRVPNAYYKSSLLKALSL